MSLSNPSSEHRRESGSDFAAGPSAEDLNPVKVEKRIQELVQSLSDALVEWRALFRAYKEADREFDRAFAAAKISVSSDVPYNDRGAHATLKTMNERAAKDVADEAFKYSEHRLDAIKKALSAWQSLGKSITTAYQNAGRIDGI